MDMDSELNLILSDVWNKIDKAEELVELKKSALESADGGKGFVGSKLDANSVDEKLSYENTVCSMDADKGGNGDDLAASEDSVSRKRKRECYLGMLNWIRNVARDPCDPAFEPLPGRNYWKCYGNELPWKQILLAREVMLLNRNTDASSQQSVWQKKQKMHPSMYDNQCGSEQLRCSQRLLLAKDPSHKARDELGSESSSDCPSDEDIVYKYRRKKRIPIGPLSQADLPEFCGTNYESDSKWLGTQVWPLDKGEQKRSIIERDPIGKGRDGLCGCQSPGSLECVRFHILQKKMKVKLELGSAFCRWKFDNMGEEVALSWTNEDQKKFEDTVKSNCLSSEKYFWEELFKAFLGKGREALVSYYYNVFLLRRRGQQNRSSTSDIGSDDEESEFGPVSKRFGQMAAITPGSIFCSPKKSQCNSR